MVATVARDRAADWSPDFVRAVVKRAVERNRRLFTPYPDISRDDLIQEGTIAAMHARETFDATRAAASTWCYRLVSFRLIEIFRTRSRQAVREARVARPGTMDETGGLDAIDAWIADPVDLEDGLPGGGHDDETLADWLGKLYRFALRVFPPRHGPGRPGYGLAQCVAATMLRRRLNLSCRGAELMFRESGEYAAALRMERAPDHNWFWRANIETDNLQVRKTGFTMSGAG